MLGFILALLEHSTSCIHSPEAPTISATYLHSRFLFVMSRYMFNERKYMTGYDETVNGNKFLVGTKVESGEQKKRQTAHTQPSIGPRIHSSQSFGF